MRAHRKKFKTHAIVMIAAATASASLGVPGVDAVNVLDPAVTIVGDPPHAAPADGEGLPAEATHVNDANGIAVHPWTGEIYWSDSDAHRIRRLDRNGLTWTVAGSGTAGFGGDGGSAAEALFNSPNGIAFDGDGNLFIADTFNHRIRRIDTLGFISTVAGSGIRGEGPDIGDFELATAADLSYPMDVAVPASGEFFYVADSNNHRVRRVNIGGIITTAAGTTQGYSGDEGPATSAQLSFPEVVELHEINDRLLIADIGNQRVRAIDDGGRIRLIAGDGTSDFVENSGALSSGVGAVRGIALDRDGTIYLSNHTTDSIYRIDTETNMTTLTGAGTGSAAPPAAILQTYANPTALAFDEFDRLLIADDDSIVRITPPTLLAPPGRHNPYGRPAEDQVRRLYRAAFDRVPEAAGLKFWVDRYQGDDTMLSLAANFIASGESIAIYGDNPSDDEFLTIVYTNVLGRGPDASGRSFWLDQLRDGRSRASVLAAFADSVENIERTGTAPPMTDAGMEVLRLYRAAFGRIPESGGFAFWLERRSAGDSLSTLAAQFIASPEAGIYLGNPEDSLFLEALYGNVLRRNADDAGLLFWEGQMRAGMSRADVLVAFCNSIENIQLTGTA